MAAVNVSCVLGTKVPTPSEGDVTPSAFHVHTVVRRFVLCMLVVCSV